MILSKFQTFNNQDGKKRVANFQHTSNPTPPNLKMNYSLLVEMPNPPQTAQNTLPKKLLNAALQESMLLQNPNAPKCSMREV
jgi:hypothetical protein